MRWWPKAFIVIQRLSSLLGTLLAQHWVELDSPA